MSYLLNYVENAGDTELNFSLIEKVFYLVVYNMTDKFEIGNVGIV